MRAFWYLALALLAARPLAAQSASDDRWQLSLVDGGYVWDVHLVRLGGDSLFFARADSTGWVSVDRLTEIRRIHKSEMRLGTPGGGAIGALTGGDDEVYDLTTLDFPSKLRLVQQLFLTHPSP